MGFYVIKGDILKQKYDAIVVPSQPSLRLEGVIGGKVERICGNKLKYELRQLKNINISECVITNAYNLSCKKIIHVANPMPDSDTKKFEYNLQQSYLSCLELAQDFELESIAFPLLSTGAYDANKRRAIEIAIQTITDFLDDNEMDVGLVIYTENTFNTYKDIFKKYAIIGGHLSKQTKEELDMMRREQGRFGWYRKDIEKILEDGPESKEFRERLTYFMTQKGLTKMDCYNGVISKTSFNNIMNGAIPKKYTVVALGINMGLDRYEIDDLLAPLGERLWEHIDKDQIIIYGLYHYKNEDNDTKLKKINKDLVSEGFVPLKTIQL